MLNHYLSRDNSGVKYITVSEILTDLQASDQTDSPAINYEYLKHATATKLAKGKQKRMVHI